MVKKPTLRFVSGGGDLLLGNSTLASGTVVLINSQPGVYRPQTEGSENLMNPAKLEEFTSPEGRVLIDLDEIAAVEESKNPGQDVKYSIVHLKSGSRFIVFGDYTEVLKKVK